MSTPTPTLVWMCWILRVPSKPLARRNEKEKASCAGLPSDSPSPRDSLALEQTCKQVGKFTGPFQGKVCSSQELLGLGGKEMGSRP